jgi:hypothetical protein
VVVQRLLRHEALAAKVADEGLLHVLVERVHPRSLLGGRREYALGSKSGVSEEKILSVSKRILTSISGRLTSLKR